MNRLLLISPDQGEALNQFFLVNFRFQILERKTTSQQFLPNFSPLPIQNPKSKI